MLAFLRSEMGAVRLIVLHVAQYRWPTPEDMDQIFVARFQESSKVKLR